MGCFSKIKNFREPVVFSENLLKKSSVIVPFIQYKGIEHILFEIRSQSVPQPGEICFPGGTSLNTDSSSADTAIRETVEELGIMKQNVQEIKELGIFHTATGYSINVFAAQLVLDFPLDLNINTNEVKECFIIPSEFFVKTEPEVYSVAACFSSEKDGRIIFPAKELNLPEKYHASWGHTEKKVNVYRTDNGIIWGITAEILAGIFKKLK